MVASTHPVNSMTISSPRSYLFFMRWGYAKVGKADFAQTLPIILTSKLKNGKRSDVGSGAVLKANFGILTDMEAKVQETRGYAIKQWLAFNTAWITNVDPANAFHTGRGIGYLSIWGGCCKEDDERSGDFIVVKNLVARLDLVDGVDIKEGHLVEEADTNDIYMYHELVPAVPGIPAAGGNPATPPIPAIPAHWEMQMPHHQWSDTLRSLTYDPAFPLGSQVAWEDSRSRMAIVDTVDQLNDRNILPLSHLIIGKLVYVRSSGTLYELIHDTLHIINTSADWQEAGSQGGVTYVGRMMNLPNPESALRPSDGSLFVVQLDFEGKPYHRLVSWDESIVGRSSTIEVTPKAHQIADILVLQDHMTAMFNQPTFPPNEGRFWVVYDAGGLTPLPGEPFAGMHLPLGAKLVNLGSNTRGNQGWAILPPDPGFSDIVGTPLFLPPPMEVADTSLPPVMGGWRWLNRKNWVHSLNATPDHVIDNQIGDFQTTTELDRHVLKVFNGSIWVTLFSEEEIKGWIASLALFRGTISEDKVAHAGTVQLNELPDLAAHSAAQDKTFVGRYWIWQGAAPYAIHGATHATPTPRIGVDLDGADLQVGDWLVVADRGNGVAGDPNEVNLQWVRVGGDLLTASRGHSLFGLNDWVDGAYEQGALVNRDGNIWRSRQAIVAGDMEPTATGGGVGVLPTVGETVPITHAATPEIIDDASMRAVLVDNPKPPQWVGYPTAADFIPTAASGTQWTGVPVATGGSFIWTGFPGLTHLDAISGLDIKDGWMHSPRGITGFVIRDTFRTVLDALAITNKWELVPVGGGVKWVPMDGDLPATGRVGDSYLIITSLVHGKGNPAIVTWDTAQNKWVPVGGAGGSVMQLDGGELIYPKVFVQNAGDAPPVGYGKYEGDLLVVQDIPNGDYHLDQVTQAVGNNVILGMPRGLVGYAEKTGRYAISSNYAMHGYLSINLVMEKRRKYKISYNIVTGVGVHPNLYYVYNELMVGTNKVLSNKLAYIGRSIPNHQPTGKMSGTVIYENPNIGGSILVEVMIAGSSGDPQAYGGQMTIEDVGAM